MKRSKRKRSKRDCFKRVREKENLYCVVNLIFGVELFIYEWLMCADWLGCGVRGSMTWVIHFGGVDLTFNFWC
jgi:hypothetical protein